MYRLKPNSPDIYVVDGPFVGRSFRAGINYPEIPSQEKHRFEKITEKPAGGQAGKKETLPAKKKEEETES